MLGKKLGHFLEKSCVRSRSYIFSPIIMKPGQNVCLRELSDVFENGQKTRTLGQILENLVYAVDATFSVR